MNMRYINNTLGTDILKNPRSCIYFSADDKIGVLTINGYMYIDLMAAKVCMNIPLGEKKIWQMNILIY
ncbi:MAG: hypothetical protein IPN14_01335 [Bacteroidetes bacterium]|nr:hypothetical protein [Bacteroidota bacterium]